MPLSRRSPGRQVRHSHTRSRTRPHNTNLPIPWVIAEDGINRYSRADLPRVGLVVVILYRLPGDDPAEPEFLDITGQMLDQTQARPPRSKHRAPQLLLGQAFQNPQDVLAQTVQGRQKRCALAASRR
jgi:hypothetical protein